MKNLSFLALIALTTTLGACIDGTDDKSSDTDTDDTDIDSVPDTDDSDTDMPDLTPSWDTSVWAVDWKDAIEANCGATEGTFKLTLQTMRWGYDAVFYIGQTRFTADYDELHVFDPALEVNSPDATGYTIFSRQLTTNEGSSSDTGTLFSCTNDNGLINPDDTDNFSVTFAAAVYEQDGTTLADCIVFGHDPAGLMADSYPSISPPGWVNSSCRNVN